MKPVAIYSSPIERTWETASAIGEKCGLEPVSHDGLLELDFGKWAGRTLRQLNQLKAWREVQVSPSTFRFPDGESFVTAQHRAVLTTLEVSGKHPKQTIVLVSHADIIKLILSFFLGQPLDQMQRLVISPGSVSIIEQKSGFSPIVSGVNLGGSSSG